MKKFLSIFLMVFVSLVTVAQNQTVDAQLNYEQTFNLFTGASTDLINDADSTWTFTVIKRTDADINLYGYLDLDSIGGTAGKVDIFTQIKNFPNETFRNVDTVTYSGTADTTFYWILDAKQKADQWRILIKGRTNEFDVGINELNLKFFK